MVANPSLLFPLKGVERLYLCLAPEDEALDDALEAGVTHVVSVGWDGGVPVPANPASFYYHTTIGRMALNVWGTTPAMRAASRFIRDALRDRESAAMICCDSPTRSGTATFAMAYLCLYCFASVASAESTVISSMGRVYIPRSVRSTLASLCLPELAALKPADAAPLRAPLRPLRLYERDEDSIDEVDDTY